ncbi:MAG: hypothetical protein V7746_06035 [Halioglobus sp.]
MTLYAVILAIYAFSMFWVFKVKNAVPGTGKRIVVALIYLAIFFGPFWDIPIQKRRFERQCEKDAGTVVHKRVGLGEEYFLKEGEVVSKLLPYGDGGRVRRDVPASGSELNVELIKEKFRVKYKVDVKPAYEGAIGAISIEVFDDGLLLGTMTSLIGSAGWLSRTINFSSVPGHKCPVYEYDPDIPSNEARLLYEVFYKLDN